MTCSKVLAAGPLDIHKYYIDVNMMTKCLSTSVFSSYIMHNKLLNNLSHHPQQRDTPGRLGNECSPWCVKVFLQTPICLACDSKEKEVALGCFGEVFTFFEFEISGSDHTP